MGGRCGFWSSSVSMIVSVRGGCIVVGVVGRVVGIPTTEDVVRARFGVVV